MILLDTHIWLWWVNEGDRLSGAERSYIDEADEIAVSAISCWEIALLVSQQRLQLTGTVLDWIETSLLFPKFRLFPISPAVAVESNFLPGEFQRDPADRIIVATARVHNIELLTFDSKILQYPHVKLAKP